MAIFFIFPGTSKNESLSQYFNYKKALSGQKNGCIVHKKFQRFQKWGQMLSLMLSSGISGTTCPGARVARSKKTPVRFCWYIPHFEAFFIPVHLHLVSWMATHPRFWVNCAYSVKQESGKTSITNLVKHKSGICQNIKCKSGISQSLR